MNPGPLTRRLAAIEAAIARTQATQLKVDAAEIIRTELERVGCAASSPGPDCVVVDEGLDRDPVIAERRDAVLQAVAEWGAPFAEVTVIVIRRLEPFPEQSDVLSWVCVPGSQGRLPTLYMDAAEVAQGTIADLARGANGSAPRALEANTEEDPCRAR